jgi:short-subunit dehydrogenase
MGTNCYKDSFIILTGAGSGIGWELVKLLYPITHNILAVDCNQVFLEKLHAGFPSILTLNADLIKKEGNQVILDWVKTHWPRVDYCFANAGKAEYGAALNQEWKNSEQLFHLNFHSPIQIGLALHELFPRSGFRLIITASAMSYWAVPGYSMYAASKSALLQWAETIWSEKAGDWLTLVFPIATRTRFFEAAGNAIPTPFPQQNASSVAKSILAGVIKGKTKIFPSPLFYILLRMNKILPVILPLYQSIEYRKYKKWLKKQSETQVC